MEASALPAPALVSQEVVLDVPALGPAAVGRLATVTPLLRLRSDEQLVALFRAGNEHAFETIHDRYRQRLFVYARQMLGGSRQDAEDALQDVFMRAYGGLRANGRPVSLKAWLYRVAHNRCVDQIRRPRPVPVEVVENPRGSLHDPIEMAERREDLRRLVADVQRLPSQQRSVLLMREIDGLAYSELAEAHDVTVPAVKSLLVRARMGLVEAREARDTACAMCAAISASPTTGACASAAWRAGTCATARGAETSGPSCAARAAASARWCPARWARWARCSTPWGSAARAAAERPAPAPAGPPWWAPRAGGGLGRARPRAPRPRAPRLRAWRPRRAPEARFSAARAP